MGKTLTAVRDLWKGVVFVTVGIALLASSFLVPFHLFLPAWMRLGDLYTVKPRESRNFSMDLMLGSVVRGMLVISGGDGSIDFFVLDSAGKSVIPESTVHDGYVYEFRPGNIDSYILFLDNSNSSAEKSVSWIIGIYYYNILFLLLGTVFSLAGAFVIFRQEKVSRSKVSDKLEQACKAVQASLKSQVNGLSSLTTSRRKTGFAAQRFSDVSSDRRLFIDLIDQLWHEVVATLMAYGLGS